jgi:hypothetical protein
VRAIQQPQNDLQRASKEQQRQDVEKRKKNVKKRRGKRQTRGKIVNENFFKLMFCYTFKQLLTSKTKLCVESNARRERE